MKSKIKRILIVSCILVLLSFSLVFAGEVNSADTFKSAWENAQNGDTITLTGDFYIESNFTLENKEITLDLNGFVISRGLAHTSKSDGNIFTLKEGAKLNIIDSDPTRTHDYWWPLDGGMLCAGFGSGISGCFQLEEDACLVMSGGGIYDCLSDGHGGAIYAEDDATIYLTGVDLYLNKTTDSFDNCHGGAIYIEDDAQLSCTNCKFRNNKSEDCGGAVYLENDTKAVFTNCEFLYNEAADDGGAVFQGGDSTVKFKDCHFNTNKAGNEGGALFVDTDEITEINNCDFRNNSSTEYGGAVYVNGDETYFTDVYMFYNNTEDYYGAAVYVDWDDSITLNGIIQTSSNKNKSNEDRCIHLADHHHVFGIYSEADLYVNSLSAGSFVHLVCDYELDNIPDEYKQYIHSDNPNGRALQWSDDEPRTVGSVFTDSTGLIVIGVVVIAVAAVVFGIINKKKKKAQ